MLVIIGDGARWIWNGATELRAALGLEKIRVAEIVDWAHAVDRLAKPATLGIKEHSQQQKWFRQMRRKMIFVKQLDTFKPTKHTCNMLSLRLKVYPSAVELLKASGGLSISGSVYAVPYGVYFEVAVFLRNLSNSDPEIR